MHPSHIHHSHQNSGHALSQHHHHLTSEHELLQDDHHSLHPLNHHHSHMQTGLAYVDGEEGGFYSSHHHSMHGEKGRSSCPISCATAMLLFIILLAVGGAVVLAVGVYIIAYKPDRMMSGVWCGLGGIAGMVLAVSLYKFREDALERSQR